VAPSLAAAVALGITVYLVPQPGGGGEASAPPVSPAIASPAPQVTATALVTPARPQQPATLDGLLTLPVADLAGVDLARMNLLCATGLPGAEGLDVDHAVAVLDQWATRVAFETDRHLYRVRDPRYAEHYGGSEAALRAEMLAQVLQEDLGVKYNPNAVGDFSFADPSVAFIHGMIPTPGQSIADTPGGTCASMPVLYVAVGRRLGYPLVLSTTANHVFARWDGLNHANPAWRERFNIETTNGFSRHDDAYYKRWPKPVSDTTIKQHGLLESLDPAETFALFLAARGHTAFDNARYAFAARCYENAYRYDDRRPSHASWFVAAARRSDYRPVTPELRSMLARVGRPPRPMRHPSGNSQPHGNPMPEWVRMPDSHLPRHYSGRHGPAAPIPHSTTFTDPQPTRN